MESKRTSFDFSLPATFLSFLKPPLPQVLDILVPIIPPPNADIPPISIGPTVLAPFIQAMLAFPNSRTEKGAKAHANSNSPLVDLFYEMTAGVGVVRLFALLRAAWDVDAESTLKTIFHARSIHEGKGNQEVCLRAMEWLMDYHPRTMLENLHLLVAPTCLRPPSKKREEAKAQETAQKDLVDRTKVLTIDEKGDVETELDEDAKEPEYSPRPHGKFKDLIDLLMLRINGQLTTTYTGSFSALDESLAPSSQHTVFADSRLNQKTYPGRKRDRSGFKEIARHLGTHSKRKLYEVLDEAEELNNPNKAFKVDLSKCGTRKAKQKLFHSRLETALETDKKFKALYIVCVKIFVGALRADLEKLQQHKAKHQIRPQLHILALTYAAKWVPSPGKGADRQLHFATALATVLFPEESDVNLQREQLQRKVLAPLRQATQVPETEMVKGLWKIDYTKVPSGAMSRHAKNFQDHDPQGFDSYLTDVAQGRITISGASLFPHELVMDCESKTSPINVRLANLQWKSLVDSIRSSSSNQLTNCMAIADVSGSMRSKVGEKPNKKHPPPIFVCLGLTLLLGELAQHPWSGSFFTFSSAPTFESIDASLDLSSRLGQLARTHWGMSTNLDRVFDQLLYIAQNENLAPDQMIRKLFVFSDMQFDEALDRQFGETEHATMKRKFEQAGYPVPEVIYWNLAGRYDGTQPTTKPVRADVEGVSIVSGFSGALMKHFLGLASDDEADAEDELGENEESDDDWEAVGANITMPKTKGTPLLTVKRIIGREPFAGVRVID